jgi:hypothetical protein
VTTDEPVAADEPVAGPRRDQRDRRRVAWAVGGVAALVGGTLLGWDARILEAIMSPPALIRAALVAAAVVLGLALLAEAIRRIERGRTGGTDAEGRDLPALVRGVRLVFLAVAAFAAAAGWLIGHPLPFIVALVIAGVDVLETSLLLLVVTVRREP